MRNGLRTTPLAPHEQAALDASYAQDAARARDGQTNHTATALRRRALAAGNGHGSINANGPEVSDESTSPGRANREDTDD